jgi:hypothetical protein
VSVAVLLVLWPGHAILFFFIIIIISGVRLSPLGTAATTGLLHHKIPHDRPGLNPRTAVVGSQRLTA